MSSDKKETMIMDDDLRAQDCKATIDILAYQLLMLKDRSGYPSMMVSLAAVVASICKIKDDEDSDENVEDCIDSLAETAKSIAKEVDEEQ